MAGHRLGSGSGVAGASLPHESAELHVSGEATYTDDIPEIQGTLHCALGMSQKAHARITAMDLDAVRRAPGVVVVLTAADIPGENNCARLFMMIRCWPIPWCNISASRCMRWWRKARTRPAGRRAWA